MEDVDAAPTAGIVGCLLVLVALALPYLLVTDAADIGAYYAAGAITPLAAGLFALVGVIVFAAGREERSDPALVAGASLVLGLFVFGICLVWAVTVPAGATTQTGTVDSPLVRTVLQIHSWLVVLASAVVPLSAAWYARLLGLL